jgi:hypothetical protein
VAFQLSPGPEQAHSVADEGPVENTAELQIKQVYAPADTKMMAKLLLHVQDPVNAFQTRAELRQLQVVVLNADKAYIVEVQPMQVLLGRRTKPAEQETVGAPQVLSL